MNDRQPHPRYLTPGEDAVLRAHYPNTKSAELAALMGMTVNQVNNYAKSRKLRKSAKYMAEQKHEMAVARAAKSVAAAKRRRELTDQMRMVAMRIESTPVSSKRSTAHGTAYQSGHITTHVMR